MAEAKKRGLLNFRSLPEVLPHYTDEKNINLFGKYGIYTAVELRSRTEIILENYSKIINIEALTALDMAKKDIVPAVTAYIKELAETITLLKGIDEDLVPVPEVELLKKLSRLLSCFLNRIEELDKAVVGARDVEGVAENAMYYKESVLSAMQSLRAVADEMESNMSSKHWPYPSYGTMLFSV